MVDEDILLFLWRHRVATFEVLRTFFYPKDKAEKAYHSLLRLRQGQYLTVEKMEGTTNSIWCLSKRGFLYLKDKKLPEISSKHYRPQSAFHDLYVASAMFGHWKLNPPDNVRLVSEQEMLTTELLFLPKEIREDVEHRPDGLWLFQSNEKKFSVALEIETTVKSAKRYENICMYYASHSFYKNVIWIIEGRSHGLQILECSKKHGDLREGLHLFIDRESYNQKGWDSPFMNNAMQGQTLAMILNSMAGVQHRKKNESRLCVDPASPAHSLKNSNADPFFNFKLNLVRFSTLRDSKSA